jgi:hypothetical protein
MQRRFRLYTECERRLADHPLAQAGAIGTPLGDGLGLEGLVAQLTPLFERERSLIRWVALRGALSSIFIWVLDRTSAVRSPDQLEQVMGLEWETNRYGESRPDVMPPWRQKLSDEQRKAAVGVASLVLVRAVNYGRLEGMNTDDVIGNQNFWMSESAALDCIAWSAIAMLRLEVAQQLFPQTPEPDALPGPDWYTEPLFGKAERYWDGSDWTSKCRVHDGWRYTELQTPLA